MSEFRRAYDLMRAYIGREFSRLQDLERELAEDELNRGTSGLSTQADSVSTSSTSVTASVPPAPVDPKEEARRVLGVAPDATFSEVRQAYMRLNKRSQAENFTAGSVEAKQAEMISLRVQRAYQVLSADASEVQKRFQSLEID